MRRIQVLVPDEQLESVTGMLEDEEFDYVRQRAWGNGEEQWIVEVPVPTDAIGYVVDQLEDAGIDTDQYTTITSLESANTPQNEALQNRFADDFDPLTRPELRSKARDISRDPRSFLVMIVLSAIIAVAGLLVGSAAVVVGSMVIAPIVGPVLTAAVGAVTDDRDMLLSSIWLQGGGLAIAIVGAVVFSFGLRASGFFPATLDISSIDLIALRVAPSFVTLAIGLAAGAAGAYGLMTKGPTALVGVMIAAALIPTAGTAGIATAWGNYRIAIGSVLLLFLTMILINVGALVTLRSFYSPRESGWLFSSGSTRGRVAVIGTGLALVVLLAVVGGASLQQIGFERSVNGEIEETLQTEEYGDLELITARIQYSGSSIGSPASVTVVVTRPTDAGETPGLADVLEERITEVTDREIDVRVRFQEYQHAGGSGGAARVEDPAVGVAGLAPHRSKSVALTAGG